MASKKKGQGSAGSKAARQQKDQVKEPSPYSPTAIRNFIHEVQAEFKKIAWPDRKVTFGLTGFVLVLVVILSIYLGSVDLILGKLVASVLQ